MPEARNYKVEIKWRNVILISYIHLAALYSLTLPKLFTSQIVGWTVGLLAGFGTTVGSHRYFTHKCFSANKKLRFLLVILQTMSSQEPVLKWARDHRVHHKCEIILILKKNYFLILKVLQTQTLTQILTTREEDSFSLM
jgi:stearoyl-CoA desaturase (delta-9 desaturase)